ncbi:MAG: glycosyltransferase, partial [Flavobacteriales bacterium]|nr:glycosyltransferase [Flavobacteriales bacterium]
KESEKESLTPGVSVIIAARNESENIFKFLPFILEQDYPDFEVVIVNHQSTDDSKFILSAYKRQYPNLRVIELEKSPHIKFGKKLPITVGVKGAKNECLLLTDADCKPDSNQWLRKMASHFTDQHQIVLGYGPYAKGKGVVNSIIRFDTAWIGISYLSMAKAKMPYMGIGRNLGYTKSVFNSVQGFRSHSAISSGDDDLFIQEAAKKKNYTINIDPETFCYSEAEKTWKDWMTQKSRHYTTAGRYNVIKKMMLGIYPLSLLIVLGTFVTLLFDTNFLLISLTLFSFITIVKWIVLGLAFKKLRESKFIAWLPLLDIGYALLAPIMYYTIDNTDEKKW